MTSNLAPGLLGAALLLNFPRAEHWRYLQAALMPVQLQLSWTGNLQHLRQTSPSPPCATHVQDHNAYKCLKTCNMHAPFRLSLLWYNTIKLLTKVPT